MQSYQISLTLHERAAGRFISTVRREIQKALAEEHAAHGATQASLAAALNVNRSVIHRQIMGFENLTLGTVGALASALNRDIEFHLCPVECTGGNHVISNSAISSAPFAAAQNLDMKSTNTTISVSA
jgi:hypothetical protein